jgi:hypothetical protein
MIAAPRPRTKNPANALPAYWSCGCVPLKKPLPRSPPSSCSVAAASAAPSARPTAADGAEEIA